MFVRVVRFYEKTTVGGLVAAAVGTGLTGLVPAMLVLVALAVVSSVGWTYVEREARR